MYTNGNLRDCSIWCHVDGQTIIGANKDQLNAVAGK